MSSPQVLIEGAKFRSDLQSTLRVLQAEWVALFNEAVNSTWNLASAARPDFQVTSQDFVLASGPSASFQVPANFHSVIDVVFAPDTSMEYSLGPFNWQNRRSPGGWSWPSYFNSGNGASSCRLMGWLVYVEPSLAAGGTYRLWYCPKPHTAVQTVRLASVAALPACTATGAGVGKKLTANANGALSVDGQSVFAADKVLVKNQVATGDDGVYTVTVAGDAGTAFVLTRTPGYDTTATIAGGMALGDIVAVGQSDAAFAVGTQEGKFFTLTTFTAIEAAQAWTEGAAIDPILEMFTEVLELKMAIPAMQRDNRGEAAAPFDRRLNGAPGQIGLLQEMKWYFSQNRGATISQMLDTDAQKMRGVWWGGGF